MIDPLELIELAKTGDATALSALVDHFNHIVEAECYRHNGLFGAEISRSDLGQEIWLRVWSKLDTFHGNPEPATTLYQFKSWLRTTARNVILCELDKWTAQKRKHSKPVARIDDQLGDRLIDDIATASLIASGKEDRARIQQAIDNLSDENTRQIVKLRFFEGHTIQQIADETQLSYDQIRHRLNQALKHLERQL